MTGTKTTQCAPPRAVAPALDSTPQRGRLDPPDLVYPKTLRKLLTLGASYGITLPTRWVRAHLHPSTPYVIADFAVPGEITIRPLKPKDAPDNVLAPP